MKIVLDTNILIDVYGKREPFYVDSAKVMALDHNIELMITANTITDVSYILRKYIQDAQEVSNIIFTLLTNNSVLQVDQQTCLSALNLPMNDYEDAVLVQCALATKADYIVTRNVKDFTNSPISVLTPSDILAKLVSDKHHGVSALE